MNAPILGYFQGAATIQERPLLARVQCLFKFVLFSLFYCFQGTLKVIFLSKKTSIINFNRRYLSLAF